MGLRGAGDRHWCTSLHRSSRSPEVDALGVGRQVSACQTSGVSRVVLVSSLCTGRLLHPLNPFGLILTWKRI